MNYISSVEKDQNKCLLIGNHKSEMFIDTSPLSVKMTEFQIIKFQESLEIIEGPVAKMV